MKTLLKIALVIALVFSVAVGANAETYVFGGGGTDFKAFNSPDGYKIDKNWGYSGGFVKTVSERVSAVTTYDYVVTKATDESTGEVSTLYESQVLVSASYLINNPTDKFQVRLLGGVEVTDGNIPDYGTFISMTNGVVLNYILSDNGMSIFGAGTFGFSKDYYQGKVRIGITYPVGNLLGGIL